MSSIATFYILPEIKHAEFSAAHHAGARSLQACLDSVADDKTGFPFSGVAYIEYFCLFVADSLPESLQAALNKASLGEHHDVFSSELAALLVRHLQAHPPDPAALATFAAEQDPAGGTDHIQCLRETHHFILSWFSRITPGSFGVLHLTF